MDGCRICRWIVMRAWMRDVVPISTKRQREEKKTIESLFPEDKSSNGLFSHLFFLKYIFFWWNSTFHHQRFIPPAIFLSILNKTNKAYTIMTERLFPFASSLYMDTCLFPKKHDYVYTRVLSYARCASRPGCSGCEECINKKKTKEN